MSLSLHQALAAAVIQNVVPGMLIEHDLGKTRKVGAAPELTLWYEPVLEWWGPAYRGRSRSHNRKIRREVCQIQGHHAGGYNAVCPRCGMTEEEAVERGT